MNRKNKKILSKGTYVILSVSLSLMLIWTGWPYFLLTSFSFSPFGIYWSYGQTQLFMLILFGITSFLLAITTLKKKVGLEDLFINVGTPLMLFLALKCAQYYAITVVIIFAAPILFAVMDVKEFNATREFGDKRKKLRMNYYVVRRSMFYPLFILFTVVGVVVNYHESMNPDDYKVLYQSVEGEAEEELSGEEIVLNLPAEQEWIDMTVERKGEVLDEFIEYMSIQLGISKPLVKVEKELTNDNQVAYYSEFEDCINFSARYIHDFELNQAIRVCSHEIYHKKEFELIKAIDILENQGMNVEKMECFEYPMKLREAKIRYAADKNESHESYLNNYLEVEANRFAEETMEELLEKGYVSKIEDLQN